MITHILGSDILEAGENNEYYWEEFHVSQSTRNCSDSDRVEFGSFDTALSQRLWLWSDCQQMC